MLATPTPAAKSMNNQVILAFSTCPDEAIARRIAEALVVEKLAGCVNRVANVRSSYIWDGRLQDDSEILLIIKTTANRLAALRARLLELHPYELPELVAANAIGGNEPYLEWIRRAVQTEDNRQ